MEQHYLKGRRQRREDTGTIQCTVGKDIILGHFSYVNIKTHCVTCLLSIHFTLFEKDSDNYMQSTKKGLNLTFWDQL